MSNRKLHINVKADSPAQALVYGKDDLGAARLLEMVLNDTRPLELVFVDGDGGIADMSGHSIKAAIGFPGETATSGSFRMKMGQGGIVDVGDIAVGTSVEDVVTALEAAFSPGIVDEASGAWPRYVFKWTTNGPMAHEHDPANLSPECAVDVYDLVVGTVSPPVPPEFILTVHRANLAEQNTWTPTTDGFEAKFDLSTDRLIEQLIDTPTIKATFEVEVTDGSGDRSTYLQIPITLRAEVIRDGATVPVGVEEYYTKAQADALFFKIAQDLSEGDAATIRSNIGINAPNTPFTPNDAADWTGTPDDVAEALDELADRTAGVSSLKTWALRQQLTTGGAPVIVDPDDTRSISSVWLEVNNTTTWERDVILRRPSSGETAPVIMMRGTFVKGATATLKIYDDGVTESTGDDLLLIELGGSDKVAEEHVLFFVWSAAMGKWDLFYDNRGSGRGMHLVAFPAEVLTLRTTNGAALNAGSESSTNKLMHGGLDFGFSNDEFAQFKIPFPPSWDEGTVCFRYKWRSPSTGDVAFALEAVSIGDNADTDPAWGNAVVVADTAVNADRKNVSAWSAAVTIANATRDGTTHFQISRTPGTNGDDISAAVVLEEVEVLYYANFGRDD